MSAALKPPEPRSDYWIYFGIAAIVVVIEWAYCVRIIFSPSGKGF